MKLIDWDGWLAIEIGSAVPSWSEPQMERSLYVSDVRADSYRHLIGREVVNWNVTQGQVVDDGGMIYFVDTASWRREIVATPIKKPRRRRYHDWKWERGQWVADYPCGEG